MYGVLMLLTQILITRQQIIYGYNRSMGYTIKLNLMEYGLIWMSQQAFILIINLVKFKINQYAKKLILMQEWKNKWFLKK